MTDKKPTEEKEKYVDFYGIGVEIYNGYKISKDGLSREEDVRVMQGLQKDEDRGFVKRSGLILRKAIKEVHNEDRETGDSYSR